MTFLHKLAKRLARLKRALIMGIVVTSACEQQLGLATAPSATVASLLLSPKTSTLSTGQTTQFAVVGVTTSGDTLGGQSVNWGSSNKGVAVVNGSGLVTALAVGAATITASSAGKSAAAALTVTLPSTNALWPHEPAGWRVLNDYDMHALIAEGNGTPYVDWQDVGGAGIANGQITVVNDPTAPIGPKVWQFKYPIGFAAGSAPATEYLALNPAPASLYTGFWWKPSNNWQGNPGNVNKLLFVQAGTGASGGLLTFQMYGPGAGPFSTRMVGGSFEDVSYGENAGSTSPLALGVWHRIEILMNSPTGALEWWVDGVLVGSYTGVPYPSGGFGSGTGLGIQFSPTWGGGYLDGNGNPILKTQNDYFWFDHIHMSRP